MDAAGDGTVSINLSLHLVNAREFIILGDIVAHIGLNCPAAIKTIIIRSGWWPGALTANINWLAIVLQVVGNVLLARRVDETSLVSVLINFAGVATVAGATSLAVHNNLSVEGDGRGTL